MSGLDQDDHLPDAAGGGGLMAKPGPAPYAKFRKHRHQWVQHPEVTIVTNARTGERTTMTRLVERCTCGGHRYQKCEIHQEPAD
jgi:hypothetical protein